MRLGLHELRMCALKILEHWQQYPEDERNRVFPDWDGNIFDPAVIPQLSTCGSASKLRHLLLDAGMRFAVLPQNRDDRTTGCISILMILGSLNQEAHDILTQYGLCDCSTVHPTILFGPAPIQLPNIPAPLGPIGPLGIMGPSGPSGDAGPPDLDDMPQALLAHHPPPQIEMRSIMGDMPVIYLPEHEMELPGMVPADVMNLPALAEAAAQLVSEDDSDEDDEDDSDDIVEEDQVDDLQELAEELENMEDPQYMDMEEDPEY
jgi:hypothetical protein